jgi:hypothetical protein
MALRCQALICPASFSKLQILSSSLLTPAPAHEERQPVARIQSCRSSFKAIVADDFNDNSNDFKPFTDAFTGPPFCEYLIVNSGQRTFPITNHLSFTARSSHNYYRLLEQPSSCTLLATCKLLGSQSPIASKSKSPLDLLTFASACGDHILLEHGIRGSRAVGHTC